VSRRRPCRRAATSAAVAHVIALATVLSAVTARWSPAAAADADWRAFSDVAAGALVAASVAVPVVDGDRDGTWQAVRSAAAVSLYTEGLKAVVHEQRPDGSGDDSFPSGHTARSFAAATTLWVRQGAAVGVPALALAGLVGVARV